MEKYAIEQQFSQYFDYETVSGKPSCRHIWRMATGLDNADLDSIKVNG